VNRSTICLRELESSDLPQEFAHLSHDGLVSVLVGFLLVASVPLVGAAQKDGCPAIGTPAAEIPLAVIADHIYTEASVNGTGPYQFIVDTGGVNLIDVSLVEQLSLKITGTEAGHGTGPGTIETGKTTVDRLTLGKITFARQPFYTFDFRQLYAGGGMKMMGMVGGALFREYVTCIDFSHNVIDLIESARFDGHRAGSGLAMSIKQSEITVHGSFDGIPGVFQIDTGSPTTLTLAAPFVAQHQLLKRFPRHVETSSGGVGGSMREYTVRGRDLALGAEQIQNPITALADVSKGKLARSDLSGNIGIGALKRYIVTFDFPGKRLFLKPYDPAPVDLDTYDRSGMRSETGPAGFRVVSVSRSTPAAEAGLHPGDIIVSVDGRPASSMTLPEFRDELRQRPPGSAITLEIKAGGERRNVRIILRDLL
jgi:PDZ domain-containing protein/aspartyl protease